jgi:SpoVK/Ycf46/Vps4 family AAA+-type ATPase
MAKKKNKSLQNKTPQKSPHRHDDIQSQDPNDETSCGRSNGMALRLFTGPPPTTTTTKNKASGGNRTTVAHNDNTKVIYIHPIDARSMNVKDGEEVLVLEIKLSTEEEDDDDDGETSILQSTSVPLLQPTSSRSSAAARISWKNTKDSKSSVQQPRFASVCRVKIITHSESVGSPPRMVTPRSQHSSTFKKSAGPCTLSKGEACLAPWFLTEMIANSRAKASEHIEIKSIRSSTTEHQSTGGGSKSQFTFEGFVDSPLLQRKSPLVEKSSSMRKKLKKPYHIAILPLWRNVDLFQLLTGEVKLVKLGLLDPLTFPIEVYNKSQMVLDRMVKAFCYQQYISYDETITLSFQGKKVQFVVEDIEWNVDILQRDGEGETADIVTCMEEMTISSSNQNDEGESDALSNDIKRQLKKGLSLPVLAKINYDTQIVFNFGSECRANNDEFEVDKGKDSKVATSASIPKNVVAGLDFVKDEIISFLMPILLHPERFPRGGPIRAPKGILLHGTSGSGKSIMAQQIAMEIQTYWMDKKLDKTVKSVKVVNVDCASIQSSTSIMGDAEKKLMRIFDEADRMAINQSVSTLLIFDDIHLICPRRGSQGNGAGIERVASTLLSLLDGIGNSDFLETNKCVGNIAILGITSNPSLLDPALRRAGRLDTELEVPNPDDNMKSDILSFCLENLKSENVVIPNFTKLDLTSLAKLAKGFTGADCALSIKESVREALSRHPNFDAKVDTLVITPEDVQKAIRNTKPSAIKSVTVEVPRVPWSSIGGMDAVKRSLREAIELPLTHGHLFSALCIPAPRGVLLYGPPGCSKTLMAKALATEGNMNFLAVKGPELLSKWLGESERALASLFRRARLASPCVIFFDEIDAIASKRGSGESSGGERMLSQLLTELDGVNTSSKIGGKEPRVVVVGATNRPDMLDSALTRPGRIDRMIYVGLPDKDTRRAIFDLQLKGKSCDSTINVRRGRPPILVIDVFEVILSNRFQTFYCRRQHLQI